MVLAAHSCPCHGLAKLARGRELLHQHTSIAALPLLCTELPPVISLQEEAQEYADETKLRELVGKYSEFINFPIYLWGSKEVDKEADEEADGGCCMAQSTSTV